MRIRWAGCGLVALAAPLFLASPRYDSAQEPSQQAAPQRPVHNEPGYYDRDAAQDKPLAEKAKADAEAKRDALLKAARAKPTPRAADGHPDLTGIWISPEAAYIAIVTDGGKERKVLFDAFADGKPPEDATPPVPPNQPVYKPELQAKVKANWADITHKDPDAFSCGNLGVPRMGMPDQIVQTHGQVTLLYHQGHAGDIPHNTFRVIYTDGRAHRTDVDPSKEGDAVGHWVGDTLVIDVTQLTDDTWLSAYGTLHSDETHVVERLTRKAGTLEYTATVEDPKVLAQPWTTTKDVRVLGSAKDALINEYPCVPVDASHFVGGNLF
jgi:hypothetical protein